MVSANSARSQFLERSGDIGRATVRPLSENLGKTAEHDDLLLGAAG